MRIEKKFGTWLILKRNKNIRFTWKSCSKPFTTRMPTACVCVRENKKKDWIMCGEPFFLNNLFAYTFERDFISSQRAHVKHFKLIKCSASGWELNPHIHHISSRVVKHILIRFRWLIAIVSKYKTCRSYPHLRWNFGKKCLMCNV